MSDLNITTHVLLFIVGGGLGLWLAARIFGVQLNLGWAFVIGLMAGFGDLVPTVGFLVSLLVMIAGVYFVTRCDPQDALFTALIGRAGILIAVLLYGLNLST